MKAFKVRVALVLFAFSLWGCPQFEEPTDNTRPGTNQETENSNANNYTEPEPDPDLLCPAEVVFREAQDATSVAVAGEFNEWDITATPMELRGGAWRAAVELAPGHYGFKFVIDGSYEGEPPPFVYTKWVGDNLNRNLVIADCSRPRLEVEALNVSPTGLVTGVLLFQEGIDGEGLDETTLDLRLGSEVVEAEVVGKEIRINHQLPEEGKYSLRARVRDTAGKMTQQNPLWIPLWYEAEEFHWFDAIMYLIFTDRFRQAGEQPFTPIAGVERIANYKGGNFQGITATLNEGYFEELGVNLLWLNPVNENTNLAQPGSFDDNMYTGYHGYWTVDPLKAEARFGGDEALHEMIATAHSRGIRVMFDLVLNQVHEDHIYCSEQPSWCQITCTCGDFGCGWDERTLDCQFAPYLPNLNYRNHELVERVVDDVMAFLAKYDIDAVRIDAAKHMEHVIMRTIRLRLNELEEKGAAPFYVVGETFTGEDGHGEIMRFVADWELHGQFDFPLLYPIRRVFGQNASFSELETGLVRSEAAYGETIPWHSPFVGNHDILRFTTYMVGNGEGGFGNTPDLVANGPANSIDQQWIIDRVLMAHAFLLTIPGIPLIYYGDEIGLAGDGDPDNRRMMQWEWNANQRAILEGIQELGQIRRSQRALSQGSRQELWIGDNYYAYARDAGSDGRVLVVMNKEEGERSEQIILPENWPDNATFVDQVSGATISASGGEITVTLGAWKYGIFVLQ